MSGSPGGVLRSNAVEDRPCRGSDGASPSAPLLTCDCLASARLRIWLTGGSGLKLRSGTAFQPPPAGHNRSGLERPARVEPANPTSARIRLTTKRATVPVPFADDRFSHDRCCETRRDSRVPCVHPAEPFGASYCYLLWICSAPIQQHFRLRRTNAYGHQARDSCNLIDFSLWRLQMNVAAPLRFLLTTAAGEMLPVAG